LIKIDHVSFTYENAGFGGRLYDINLEIPDGQVVLLCGESGSGKTTFSRLINGLIPNYYDGELEGKVYIDDLCVSDEPLYRIAGKVGSVFQNPKSQFYTLLTDTEIVFACENLGLSKEEILNRFDETVESLHLNKLLGRNLFRMSGGEKQRIACASAHAMKPDIYVVDEPTSNLDIGGIGDLKKILKVWKEKGKTIIVCEHRLSWLTDIADRVIVFEEGRIKEDLDAKDFRRRSADELHKAGLRAPFDISSIKTQQWSENPGEIVFKDFLFKYKKSNETALAIEDLSVPKNSVVAVLGDNGAGKSTFAKCLCGLEKKCGGVLRVNDNDYPAKERIGLCYMVMQDVNHQLFTQSVLEEVTLGTTMEGADTSQAEKVLEALDLLEYKALHPMSLSGGQRQRVAIASAVASGRDIIVYDEPTSGLDYRHMKEVAGYIKKLSDEGKSQFVITHDAELVTECCNYFIFIENGKVVRHGRPEGDNLRFVSEYFEGA